MIHFDVPKLITHTDTLTDESALYMLYTLHENAIRYMLITD